MSKFAPHRRSANNPRPTASTVCQKCLGTGHFTYECKSSRPYISRPSRTKQLENPRVLAKLKADGKPSVEVPEEFTKKTGTADRILEAKEKAREKEDENQDGRKKRRRSSESGSNSSSDTDSDSDSDSDSSDSESNTDSDSRSSSGTEVLVRVGGDTIN
ncbi:uncharacterized protein FIBRA_03948 [Fibroporia radiculosa]|uniref:Zinc knuckle-domain-containing protein n=1 Tax=Fibroporia radiculosa TaxID=599839 RepID=J4HW96_9APHY|nr:uncharacterized protein FIBRA_03948 [Fibroporia radiculosa]CCM01877.1 predicted protein [Fibroporia radiculosa]